MLAMTFLMATAVYGISNPVVSTFSADLPAGQCCELKLPCCVAVAQPVPVVALPAAVAPEPTKVVPVPQGAQCCEMKLPCCAESISSMAADHIPASHFHGECCELHLQCCSADMGLPSNIQNMEAQLVHKVSEHKAIEKHLAAIKVQLAATLRGHRLSERAALKKDVAALAGKIKAVESLKAKLESRLAKVCAFKFNVFYLYSVTSCYALVCAHLQVI